MSVIFGPAGLGPVKTAPEFLTALAKQGLHACEIAFTYGVYVKPEEAAAIKAAAEKNEISLSIHAPYYINLNSAEKKTIESSKSRIMQCCEIGELLGVKTVVFHPGYYGDDREKAYETIREGIAELVEKVKKKGWKIQIAPETMGKVNVFGSIEEISRLAAETGCSFCIDFAHILAREKKVDYEKIKELFPQKRWHVHFSGIVYGDKGEKHHRTTEKAEWNELLMNLPKDKEIVIINESPTMVEDSVEGLKLYSK